MPLSLAQMRAHIFLVILDRFSGSRERRQEALAEYFLVTMPNVPEDAAKRLAELYSLDQNCTLFRLLRHFWPADRSSQPMLAFLLAAARDPLLREATPFVLAAKRDSIIAAEAIGEHLKHEYPSRFRPSTLHSTAQNLASSWTQAGYLQGKVRKRRVAPRITAIVAAYAMVLGHLCGFRGKLLLDCQWTRFLDSSPSELVDLIQEASKQGWLRYKGVGSVVEITFPGLLKSNEEQVSLEQN